MIISPPFLPARGAAQTEDAWLDAAMPAPASRLSDTHAAEGSFPLSHNVAWHNGVHIQAPVAAGVSLPVRAMADGTVVFMHAPAASNTNVDDPQNYNPFDPAGAAKTAAWTDNGCVVIEHTTTVGATGTVETQVVFYSVTMHLNALGKITPAGQTARRDLRVGDAIWRKDEVGSAGQIYGHAGQIHFEVCCDAENLQRLIGRAPTWVEPAVAPATFPEPTADGRIDSIFGSLYFFLPASTPIDAGATMPTSHLRRAQGAAGTTLGAALWVKMTYERGACTFESFDERGALIHALPAQVDAEYDLYREATDRHSALPAASQAASSPSGWYELLRFGRNIGRGAADVDKDPLPNNAAHWRRIAAPNRTPVWADLNGSGSFKFSDADFLPVMGWNCIDDDTSPNDQRCDSNHLKELIRDPDAANGQRMETDQLAARLGNPDVRARLRRAICKFPSEWDRQTTGERYGFAENLLQTITQGTQAWTRLRAHLQAISFAGLPASYLAADWHWHPREFFEVTRRCGWLSQRELSQLLPRRYGPSANELTVIPWATAQARFNAYAGDLNRTFRKYLIDNAVRQTHFLAQTYIETAIWQTMEEFGRAHQQRRRDGSLYWPAPAMEFYQAFYGRGIMQLTWAGNYDSYGTYRTFANVPQTHAYRETRITHLSQHYWADPRDRQGRVVQRPQVWYARYDPADIASSPFNSCDSGAHYWVSKNTGHSLLSINRVCDQGVSTTAVGRASVLVNGGGYGFAERQAYASYIVRYRGDSTDASAIASFNVTHGNRTHSVYVDFTPQRP